MAVRAPVTDYVRRSSGRIVPEATVVISQGGTITNGVLTGGTPTPVYQSTSGTAQVGSGGTLTADDAGRYTFYADEGDYNRTFSHDRYETWSEPFPAVSGLSPGGRELGYAEILSSSAVTGTTQGDGTNPLVLPGVVIGARPVMLRFDANFAQVSVDGGLWAIFLMQATSGGAYSTVASCSGHAAAANGRSPVHREIRRSLTPGTYDFKIQLSSGNAAHTATINASATNPAFLQVIEV